MTNSLSTYYQNVLPKDGEVYYIDSFLTSEEQKEFFTTLKNECSWEQEEIQIFGKKILSPRLTAYYGEKEYTYSGVTHTAKEYPNCINYLLQKLKENYQLSFNSVLLNYYRDGKDSMGWHQDNERELGINPTIASINLGETRKFSFKHCKETNLTNSLFLKGGSLLLMTGEIQHHWKHQLPKTAKEIGERINITCRNII